MEDKNNNIKAMKIVVTTPKGKVRKLIKHESDNLNELIESLNKFVKEVDEAVQAGYDLSVTCNANCCNAWKCWFKKCFQK